MTNDDLRLGPLLRHVDETSAAIWVEMSRSGEVSVTCDDRTWVAKTFTAHGHHYALVEVTGLAPASKCDYTVAFDGATVWPPADSDLPPSRIATLEPGAKLRMAFGSCRKSLPHDAETTSKYGVDVLRAYALHMLESDDKWPDLLMLLGDQVYADETSDAMQRFIESRRDISKPPGVELKDFEEYTYLYYISWTDPMIQWVLSTLPTAMIFDDHDVRDDWNTSHTWREEMNAKSWWRERIQGGLASYWVYQHLGNLSISQRADDEVWQQIVADDHAAGHDFGPMLSAFAERADRHPDSYRWSYARDIATSRLVVVDSRAARMLSPDQREMLDDNELAWLDEQLCGDVDHLLIATSLPYLMGIGLHQLEAWDEAVAEGAWGRWFKTFGEKVRQTADLEHWAAFQNTFRLVADKICEVADGSRGRPPTSIVFLSGDVHNSYLARVTGRAGGSAIVQAVCSPIRNWLPAAEQKGQAIAAGRFGRALGKALARSAKVEPPPFNWETVRGPWFDNNIATLEAHGGQLQIRWERGVVSEGGPDKPDLDTIYTFTL